MTKPVSKSDLFASPYTFLGLGFGSGLAPVAPGTFGTLAAIPLYFLLYPFGSTIYFIALVFIMGAGIIICQKTADHLNSHDHPGIVWDEIAGFLLTMAWVVPSIAHVLMGFLLFRLFDIVKPWPIKWIDQKVHGGFGIMLDDLIAGVFAGVILWWLSGRFF